jgi:ATP-dependent DNA helicase RecQ
MDSQSGVGCQGEHRALDVLLQRALLLDLEVSHSGKILKLGAAIGDSTLAVPGSASLDSISHPFSKLAAGATCVLGHNLVRHDLPVLREHAPTLALHHLPVIDTLVLSPICFPENPYHRLVKDYKLHQSSA